MSRMIPLSLALTRLPIKNANQDALYVKVSCHDDKLDFYQVRYYKHFNQFFHMP